MSVDTAAPAPTGDAETKPTDDTTVDADKADLDAKGGDTSAPAEGDKAAKKGLLGDAGSDADDQGNKGEPLEFTLPEGVEVDQPMLDSFKAAAPEMGLDGDAAGKLVAWFAKHQEQTATDQMEAWDKQRDDWEKEIQSDPDFGGKAFDATVNAAKKALIRFGGAELAEELNRLGVDSNPHLVKAFARIGQALAEDNTGEFRGSGGPAPKSRSQRLATMYPSLGQEAQQ